MLCDGCFLTQGFENIALMYYKLLLNEGFMYVQLI